MQLPLLLRHAIDGELAGVTPTTLSAAAGVLSGRYRAELRDGRLHVADHLSAQAYVATRMPGTYAALRTSLASAALRLADFTPGSLLDVGAGPGTALWAALSVWPDLSCVRLLEASAPMRAMGERLTAPSGLRDIRWIPADIRDCDLSVYAADVVTASYVLDELEPGERSDLIARLWSATRDLLVIVEPGTSGGWRRILEARRQLTAAGASITAPCAHAQACPVHAPDWCHFSARTARSRIHRLAKGAEAPWEDEAFAYLAVSRQPAGPGRARVLAPPQRASGRVRLRLCTPQGEADTRLVTRRDGELFREARRADWGDLFGS